MSEKTKLITNSVFHIIKILELMKESKGTNIKELCKELKITRRSIFRLLNTIEKNLCIPFTIERNTFGGIATYHLSPEYSEKLSAIKLPELKLSFNQAVFIYLVLKDMSFPRNDSISKEIKQLQKYIEISYI